MAQMDHYMRGDDPERMAGPHAAFHARFVSRAGPRMTTTLAQLFDHGERYRRAYGAVSPGRWPQRRAEHRAILDAAIDGDAQRTVERLVAHYANTAMTVISKFDATHESTLLRTAIAAVAPAVLEAAVTGAPKPTRRAPRRAAAQERAH
jgi:DNA-binding GntR family transcriptional regulator